MTIYQKIPFSLMKEKQTEIDKRALDTVLYINYLLNAKRV